ncbi:TonB-dependent receptor domain-containing protein [Azonexus sp.]|uniref:TonB-dependent receptor n=1 Tax=Azonexus sp. TaxID=1872668 RepID=UPI0035B3B1DA
MSHRKRRAAAGSRSVLCFAVVGLAGASPLLAADAAGQPAPEEIQAMAEVTVTATRTERRLDEVPASVSVLNAKEIASQQVVKTEDLLRNLEGVDVKNQAGGTVSMVSLRGLGGSFAGQTTQVLVDGMAVEPVVLAPKGAAFDFADLGDVDRIEVVRGPAAALYGPSAMGGVVNVLTRRPTAGLAGEIEVGAGSHNTRTSRAVLSGGYDKVDFRLYASEFDTDGYVAEPRSYAMKQQDLKGRDWRRDKSGFSLGLYPSENQEIRFGVRNYRIDSAWIGGHPQLRWDREGTLWDVGYKLKLGEIGDFRLKYLSTTIREHLSYDGMLNRSPADFTRYAAELRSEYGDLFEAVANIKMGAAHLLTLGFSDSSGRQVEGMNLSVPADSPMGIDWDFGADILQREGFSGRTRVFGLFAQDEIALSDSTRLLVGGRYDRFRLYRNSRYLWDNFGTDTVSNDPDSSDGVFNPRLGVHHRLAERTSVYAAYGTAYLPALNTLRYRGNSACNNPDLEPERSTSYEFGFSHEAGSLLLRGAVFHTDYEDKIETRSLSACSPQFLNVGSVRLDGLELGVEGRLASSWKTYANYTFNDAKIADNPANPASEGKRLNWTPRHKFNVGVLYAPSRDLTARLSGRYVGDRYFDGTMTNSPDSRAPAYFVADFKISRRVELGTLARSAELSFAVNNLFDRDYVEQKGYAAGLGETYREYADRRNFWVGLKTLF